MNTMTKAVLAAALATASVSASAWWGGPWSNGWGDDFFGDGGFNFSVSAGAGGHGWGRYYDHYAPYRAYPYGAAPPYGLSTEQQKAFADQQPQALEQAVEAQRKLAERLAAKSGVIPHPAMAGPETVPRVHELERELIERAASDERRFFDRIREDLAAQPAPVTAPTSFGSFEDRMKEIEAQREQSKKEMAALREESAKEMHARRAEALKRFEEQREAAYKRSSAAL